MAAQQNLHSSCGHSKAFLARAAEINKICLNIVLGMSLLIHLGLAVGEDLIFHPREKA